VRSLGKISAVFGTPSHVKVEEARMVQINNLEISKNPNKVELNQQYEEPL